GDGQAPSSRPLRENEAMSFIIFIRDRDHPVGPFSSYESAREALKLQPNWMNGNYVISELESADSFIRSLLPPREPLDPRIQAAIDARKPVVHLEPGFGVVLPEVLIGRTAEEIAALVQNLPTCPSCDSVYIAKRSVTTTYQIREKAVQITFPVWRCAEC